MITIGRVFQTPTTIVCFFILLHPFHLYKYLLLIPITSKYCNFQRGWRILLDPDSGQGLWQLWLAIMFYVRKGKEGLWFRVRIQCWINLLALSIRRRALNITGINFCKWFTSSYGGHSSYKEQLRRSAMVAETHILPSCNCCDIMKLRITWSTFSYSLHKSD